MKKTLVMMAVMLAAQLTTMNGQTYSSLWRQVKDAEQKDLPQTARQVLGLIAEKAEREADYGQLMKAELMSARMMSQVAPDSLAPAVERLKTRLEATADVARQAVLCTVLGYLYENIGSLDPDNHMQVAAGYYDRALSHPDRLAAVKAVQYEPFVVEGADSRVFGDDLLSVIGHETGRYKPLADYYSASGNRRAALLSTVELLRRESPDEMEPLNKSAHLQRIDSLIAQYQDLPEAGEAAIARYDFMARMTDATVEQKWQYINFALDRWPSWQRMNLLRNRQRDLTSSMFEAEFGQLGIPESAQTVKVERLRGVNQLTMRVYSIKADGDIDVHPETSEGYRKLKPLLTLLPHMTQTRTYMGKKPYETFDDSLTLQGLPAGVYMVEMETQPQTQTSRRLYFVSDVRVLMLGLPDDNRRYVVVNATTGQPLKGARLRLTERQGRNRTKSVQTLTADQQGEVTFRRSQHYGIEAYAYTGDDRFCPPVNAYGYYGYYEKRRSVTVTEVYTDREIYRPGQTVNVAAIVYKSENGYDNHAIADRKVTLKLRDANYQTVAETETTTDRFGTCTAQFRLPQNVLSGLFSVSAEDQTRFFNVEEYKRPSFEVDMPPVSQNYDDGDTVVARGTARSYSGVPVQGARVKYKVVRRRAFWWTSYSRHWSWPQGAETTDREMAAGETVTAADGSFSIDVPMVLPKSQHPMFYNFVVTADVTDQAGETHQAVLSLPMGNRKAALSATMPEKVLAEQDTKMAFHLLNAAGVDMEATVRYRFDNGRWQETGTNALFLIPQMKSGRHTLYATCEADTLEQTFTVFSLDDKRPAIETDDWFFQSHDQFPSDGTPVTIQVGSSDRNVHIVYAILSGQRVVESGAVDRSNELLNRKLTYEESMGDGLLLSFAWVKNGRTYTHNATIRRPLPDKSLRLTWKTFRNRLQPGQQEEWTLSVTTHDGSPADAQLMATLYDKSLDQMAQHQWSLVPREELSLPHTRWNGIDMGTASLNGYRHQGVLTVGNLSFSHFDHDVYPYQYNPRLRIRGRLVGAAAPLMMADMAIGAVDNDVAEYESVEEVAVAQVAATKEVSRSVTTEEAEDDSDTGATAVQMRENMQETAFFQPQLVADAEGNVVLRFTLPESLTTWRFMGIAHTEDMMHGMLTDEAVARKEVMIQPNMPRFVRMGDRATISARVFNTGEKPISGTARIQLLDPETEKVVAQSAVPVELAPDSATSVSFICHPLSTWPSLLVAKVSIGGRTFSDGEQHYLPVLSDREQVTVTVPFTQNEPGTKEIDLDALLPRQSTLTIEYTNNPAWLMIQALPSVATPHDDCAICLAASLYANAIGRHILGQNPTAKHVFEQWSREQGDETSLHSNLQKNQQLRELLLKETPWVTDARREQEQKQRLADFFDHSLLQQRLDLAIEKLANLQNADGSWSWWTGMKGSACMTVSVAEMLVRLNKMTGRQGETASMLDRAMTFMGRETVEMVNEMKKDERKGHRQSFPSFRALQWLYIAAIDGRALPSDVNEANTYLKNLLRKENKNQSMLEKAMSAIVLNNATYVKSLKEYTVYNEETGRYYDTPRASYSWRDYRIPTQVAAIEALQLLSPKDTKTIEEMQRWLLQEKRTQAWDTPLNSIDAIYAFLNGRPAQLEAQPRTVLKIDGRELETSQATAGIGYVKTSMTTNGEKKLTAEKTSQGTSWGAVYAQFMQDVRDIADRQSGIKVKRELLSPDGKPQTDATFGVGDRIKVRITIQADRDYDFVEVTDKRAACLEPVQQLSGYGWGYYCTPRDCTTNYYFDRMAKGRHVIETEYYIDRPGTYETGTCTAECAYSPEFRGQTRSMTINCVDK